MRFTPQRSVLPKRSAREQPLKNPLYRWIQ